MICSFNFLNLLAVCLNISTVINIKILTNSNQQTWSYKFTSHIAAFLCGFDHRDASNLHTNIIWSKRSTDFKELSPCSVWYPLKWDDDYDDICFVLDQHVSWIIILLAHWNNSPHVHVDMSLHSDTLSWFWANQSLLLLHELPHSRWAH